MGGEVVALDRHFFRSVGGYDPGMLLWGEEQIELSVRVRRTGSANPHWFYLLTTPRAMTEFWVDSSSSEGSRNVVPGHDAVSKRKSQVASRDLGMSGPLDKTVEEKC